MLRKKDEFFKVGIKVKVKLKLICFHHFLKAIQYAENNDLQIYKLIKVNEPKPIKWLYHFIQTNMHFKSLVITIC